MCWKNVPLQNEAENLSRASEYPPPTNLRQVIGPNSSYYSFFFNGAKATSGPRPSQCRGFTITLRPTTLGRTPLDESSANRSDFYPKTHNTHNRYTSMPPAGFEPTVPASKRPHTVRPLGSTFSHLTLSKLILGEQNQCEGNFISIAPRSPKEGRFVFTFIPCTLINKCLLYTNICTSKWCKFIFWEEF